MNDPPAPPVRGLVAGKYEIVRLIGRGGMGSVYEGRHVTLGTRVAIKFIDQEHADSQETRSRFATEARTAATIQSKHAIQIFDHGVTDDGKPYIVMELLDGEPLDKRLERLGRISLLETARLLGQVCRALQRAHDAGIIHRDLKPENIYLVRSPDDDYEFAKVLDFGIAKIRAPAGGAVVTSSTKTGAVLGTPYYMAPEQARGLRSIDHRADLWSLGVIAYKCTIGALPFEGESIGDLLVKICTAPLPVPSQMMPGLPRAFDTWFFRALERDPARRFATASELGESLAYAAGLSSGAKSLDEQSAGANGVPPTLPSSLLAPMPAAGITSSPFTHSAPRLSSSSRGLWVLAATLVGGSIGVFGVMKVMSTPDERAAAGRRETGDAAPGKAAPDVRVTPALSLEPLSPTTAPSSTQTVSAARGAPSPAAVAPAPAHPSLVRPLVAPSARPAPPVLVPPPLPPRMPPPKPSNPAADPGY